MQNKTFINAGWKKTRHPCLSSIVVPFCILIMGFLDNSAGKESACDAGNPSSIPGLGSSPGEAIGCPLQHSRASLLTQIVKNLPAMWETWVRSLAWEDSLEEGMANHSSILAWRIPMDRGAWRATVAKWCSKFPKPGFSSMCTEAFQMFRLDLEKAKEPESKLPTSVGS